MENPPCSTTSYKHFWLELLRMDVRDWDFSPMSLHYRDLMTTAIALTNEGRRYDWVRLSQSIACIMTRKITMILPCPFTRADVSVRRRATTAKCLCCVRGRTADSRKRDAHTVPIKRLVFFFCFHPQTVNLPTCKMSLNEQHLFFSQGQKNNRFLNPADFLWVCVYVCVPCCLQFTLALHIHSWIFMRMHRLNRSCAANSICEIGSTWRLVIYGQSYVV